MKNKKLVNSTVKIVATIFLVIAILLVISEISLMVLKPCEKVSESSCSMILTCEPTKNNNLPEKCDPEKNEKIEIGECLILSSGSQGSISCQQETLGATKVLLGTFIK